MIFNYHYIIYMQVGWIALRLARKFSAWYLLRFHWANPSMTIFYLVKDTHLNKWYINREF